MDVSGSRWGAVQAGANLKSACDFTLPSPPQAVAFLNYTEAEAEAGGPGFWDRAAAQIAAAKPDALLVCDEVPRASQLMNRLTNQEHVRLSALWMASYGNSSDFVTQLVRTCVRACVSGVTCVAPPRLGGGEGLPEWSDRAKQAG